jgi:hypothetical protein
VDAFDYLKERNNEVSVSTKASYGFGEGQNDTNLFMFGGGLGVDYSSATQYAYSSRYSYASCDTIKNKKRIYVSADVAFLRNYLNPVFVSDLNTLPAKDIIKKYGTHVLTDITIGGRLNLVYESEITSTTDYAKKS